MNVPPEMFLARAPEAYDEEYRNKIGDAVAELLFQPYGDATVIRFPETIDALLSVLGVLLSMNPALDTEDKQKGTCFNVAFTLMELIQGHRADPDIQELFAKSFGERQ
jgi:hypothetical protein